MKFGKMYDNSPNDEIYLSEDKQREYWYKTGLEAVKIIDDGREHRMRPKIEWRQTLFSNKEHLEIILTDVPWTDQDIQPFRDAVTKATSLIAAIDE